MPEPGTPKPLDLLIGHLHDIDLSRLQAGRSRQLQKDLDDGLARSGFLLDRPAWPGPGKITVDQVRIRMDALGCPGLG